MIAVLVPCALCSVQSQKMGLTRLSCLCQRQLEARLDPNNAAAMLEAADTHHALPLRTSCLRYILQNFSQVSRTHGFLVVRCVALPCVIQCCDRTLTAIRVPVSCCCCSYARICCVRCCSGVPRSSRWNHLHPSACRPCYQEAAMSRSRCL